NAAANGHPWLALVACLLPGRAVGSDLGSLLDVERLASFVVLERRTLQAHAQLRCPYGRGVRAGSPPDAITQPRGVRFRTQQSRRVWKHRPRTGLREALAAQHVEKDLCMASTHIGIALALGRLIAEIP